MTTRTWIDSLSDPRLDGFRDVRDRDLRGRDGLFIAESAKVVERLIRSRFAVESILLSPRREQQLAATLATLPASIPVYVAPEPLLHDISGYHVHGGALALGRRPDRHEIDPRRVLMPILARPRATIVACAGVTHLDNIGSIFRSAAALGADAVLLTDGCCDPLLRKPIRVAMGHSLSLPWAEAERFTDAIESLSPGDEGEASGRNTFTVVALETGDHPGARGAAIPLDRMPKTDRMVIVAGAEGAGLPTAIVERCDAVCEIPMRNGVPSLNVAMAVGVALYERGRGEGDGR